MILPEIRALQTLRPDGRLLFAARLLRLFAFGALSVVLVLYLAQRGLSESEIGGLLSLSLLGDVVVSFAVTSVADRVGRRRMLIISACLLIGTGIVFALTDNILLLTLAAIIGTISASGAEVGPFLAIEQAMLPQMAPSAYRTHLFAWYNLAGSGATAVGALCGGVLAQGLQNAGQSPLASYQAVVIVYTLCGFGLLVLFARFSSQVEAPKRSYAGDLPSVKTRLGLHRSRGVVLRLATVFALDAFAGGFVVQSFVAYWFHQRFGVMPTLIGSIFFAANLLAGVSALLAARLAARIGLINTMVWTHLPSNVLLLLIPFMPTLFLASTLLLLRFSISQMDVPTRQSYTVAVVAPDERVAAAGVMSVVRSAASTLSPFLTGMLLQVGLLSIPFVIAGSLKIVYDLLLYQMFRSITPQDEAS